MGKRFYGNKVMWKENPLLLRVDHPGPGRRQQGPVILRHLMVLSRVHRFFGIMPMLYL